MQRPHSTADTARRASPIRVYRLGEEPGDDLSAISSPEERLAMVAELSRRLWTLTRRPVPSYERATMPGRVLRGV